MVRLQYDGNEEKCLFLLPWTPRRYPDVFPWRVNTAVDEDSGYACEHQTQKTYAGHVVCRSKRLYSNVVTTMAEGVGMAREEDV